VGSVSPKKPVFNFAYPLDRIGIVETLRVGLVIRDASSIKDEKLEVFLSYFVRFSCLLVFVSFCLGGGSFSSF
jgi:hypothetical protein